MKHAVYLICCFWIQSVNAQSISFSDPVDVSAGSVQGVSALDVADFNQDGLLDIVGEDQYAQEGRPWFYECLLK